MAAGQQKHSSLNIDVEWRENSIASTNSSNIQNIGKAILNNPYGNLKKRCDSFENRKWPQHHQHLKIPLAANGFILNTDGDAVCFGCKERLPEMFIRTLKDNVAEDILKEDIWRKHSRISGKCAFLRLLIGDTAVDKECDAAMAKKVRKMARKIQAGTWEVDQVFLKALDYKTEIELLTMYISKLTDEIKDHENKIRQNTMDKDRIHDNCMDLMVKNDKLMRELTEIQEKKNKELKEQRNINQELSRYARYLETKTEMLNKKNQHLENKLEGLKNEYDQLDRKYFKSYFGLKGLKTEILKLNTEKENLVLVLRKQGEEVDRLKREIQQLKEQNEECLCTEAQTACIEMGYSRGKVQRALQIYRERQGSLAEHLLTILMEIDMEQDPQGAVGGKGLG